MSFGGNDDQDVQLNGRYITFDSPRGRRSTAARVQQVVATAHAANAELLWSGLPVMRSAAKTQRLHDGDGRSPARALAGLPGAFVDNRATLADRGRALRGRPARRRRATPCSSASPTGSTRRPPAPTAWPTRRSRR